MSKDPSSIPPFSSGTSSFLVEGDHVRVLGEEGTEATIPLEDLEALLEQLESPAAPLGSQEPDLSGDEDKE
jgi:hypothetical protein